MTTKITRRPWDPSTLIARSSRMHPSNQFSPLGPSPGTSYFIYWSIPHMHDAHIAWENWDCARVLKRNKDKTNTSFRCVPNIRTTAASMKCVRRGIDPYPTALQNHSPRVHHSSLTSVWLRSHDFRWLWWVMDQATETGRKILNKPNFILFNESFVCVYNLYQAYLRFSTSGRYM